MMIDRQTNVFSCMNDKEMIICALAAKMAKRLVDNEDMD